MDRIVGVVAALAIFVGRAGADMYDWPTNAVLTGVVRDGDGKPIPWAAVTINGSAGGLTTYNFNSRGFTDLDGRFRLTALVHRQEAQLLGIYTAARGFVFQQTSLDKDGIKLRPGQVTELPPITLERGEILEGTAEIPLKAIERLRGIRMQDRNLKISIRGPSFQMSYWTDMNGRFEVYVPKGNYVISVAGEEKAVLRDVAAGQRGLKLVREYTPATSEVLAKAFDALWEDMDRNYSYFELKQIDWKKLREQYRSKAIEAGSAERFADVIAEMLGHLHDMHVSVRAPHDQMPTYVTSQRRDRNGQVVVKSLVKPMPCGDLAVVGRLKTSQFAAVILNNQPAATKEKVAMVVDFIRNAHDAPGFIVDLRSAAGGNEVFAREIAQEFCAKQTLYAKSKFRNGSGHGDFGPVYDRMLKAVESPYTKPVVCILGPGAVSSGEGFAKMMACLPNVTTVGSPTRGSSGNPKEYRLPGVPVVVSYSRWVDMMPDGMPVEGRGVIPKVRIEPPESAFDEADPVWEKAIEILTANTRKAD